ncbi:JAB domain-containing protein [Niabella ginsengisoli]|uniref:JAB domain-containing protein n=1 Tax=Niabella ginsengisoli TaxID=522298 RepID=A0ABS9SMB1_9BACT|nr:JAB domain-containing protein [Niabella ginsengisoli]MCH5599512.1 JAB domain-containing protein [Niabella ginsengisoli]
MESVCNKENLSVIAEVELVYKNPYKTQMPFIKTSRSAYELLLAHWDEYRIEYLEQFKIILLNQASRVLCICNISTGGMAGIVVDPKLVFTAALKSGAVGVLLSHNHPSGSLKPSRADEYITKQLVEAGRLLDIKILDHLIITPDGYFSFSDQGLL